jgi:cytoskeletal protein CcmA (bactofilin family)
MAQILDLGKLRFNWTGNYSASTEYTYNDLVKYGPNLYVYAAQNSSIGVAPNPPTTAQWKLVAEGLTFRGTYNAATQYYKNDIVTDTTSSYIVLNQHVSTTNVAAGNPDLQLLALGQEGLPNQTGNANKVLTTDGAFTSWDSIVKLDKTFIGSSQGEDAEDYEIAAGLTDVVAMFYKDANDFAQLAFVNGTNAANASTDFIAYTADGNNDSGWIDLGITSRTFSEESFGITGPHDGYIFMSAPRGETSDITVKSVLANTATFTTAFPHGFQEGDVIRIEEMGTPFDGLQTITDIPSPTQFSFTTTSVPVPVTPLSEFGVVYRPAGNGNMVFATDQTGLENNIVFAAGGFVTGRTQMQILPDTMVHIEIDTESNDSDSGALVVRGGAGFNGAVSVSGLVRTEGSTYIGAGAEQFEEDAELTNAKTIVIVEGDPYAQIAVHNPTPTSSTDVLLYADNGTDTSGWIDVGITGSEFEQAEFGVTGPNDGYVFFEAPEGTTGKGNLVIATGDKGSENKIIIAAGGFATGTEQLSITPGVNVHVEIPTPSISPTTGALTVVGGVGIVGDVNIAGSITFGGAGTTVETENLAITDALVLVGSGSETVSNDLSFVTEGKYVLPGLLPTVSVTSGSLAANVATLNTYTEHDFVEGDVVTVANSSTAFDGTYTIVSVPTPKSFTYNKVNIDIPSTPFSQQNFAVTNKALVSNVATLTIGTNNLEIGDEIIVTGVDATFNGTHIVTGVGSDTVSYAKVAADVTSTSSSGNVYMNQSVVTAIVPNPIRTRWSALSKRATNGEWNIVSGLTSQPNPQVNYSDPALQYDSLKIGNLNSVGNGSFDGTLQVDGLATIGGSLGVTGTLSVNTNRFTVNPTTGNTSVLGTLAIGSDLSINTDKFNVNATTGDTDIAGTLDVTSTISAPSVTLTGTVSANTDATNKAYVDRATGVWTTKTANYVAAAGDCIFADTSSASFNVTLPGAPSIGDFVKIADVSGSFGDRSLTVLRNGQKIMEQNEDLVLDINNSVSHLVFSGTTYGWRLV